MEGTYDGEPIEALRARWGVPSVRAYHAVASTMDVAHAAAANGAPAGTVVVADVQTAGRGRNGRRWVSDADAGVWTTVVERPRDVDALAVLSLRVGLALSTALEPLAGAALALKWPNDVLRDGRKVAGVLVEARWREGIPEWVAIGIGVNRAPPPDLADAAGVGAHVTRRQLLEAVVHAVRGAAAATGALSRAELATFASRDAVRGRMVVSPVAGEATGVNARGELLIRTPGGLVAPVPTATVVYADPLR